MYSIMFNEILPAPPPPPPPPPPQDDVQGLRFPVYLLPSLAMPFRRRRQSSYSNPGRSPSETIPSLSSTPTDSASSSPVESPTTPSFFLPINLFKQKDHHKRSSLEPSESTKLSRTQPNTIRCSTCASDFAFASQIVSKGFTGRYGRAFLVSPPDKPFRKGTKGRNLINIKVGKCETRVLVTGSHIVADIICAVCDTKVGWKYIDAKEESQKYKVGKFILETQRVVVYRNWEDIMVDEVPDLGTEQQELQAGSDDEPVMFDSEDEDECEDLFTGAWDADVVAKRRSRKVNRRQKKSSD
ncbi:yippee-domain-containing protein [Rostrohypoxylon terebratum]|nr:yippee-domain-containing protein [Rostrohypoxylon terebratum]